ncbi:hypothetical protein BH10PSE12_BH10PSE12_23290 [soil metagenome]
METLQAPEIVASPDLVDAAWMDAALRAAGVLDGARVVDVTCRPVGNGLVSDSFRFTLTYEGDAPDAPKTVVGKFPDEASLAAVGGFFYMREVLFYSEFAHRTSITKPRPYFAKIDVPTGNFTLILEDMGPARPGDQLEGCSLDDARTAMLEAAALHAPFWRDAALGEVEWLAPWMPATIPYLEPAVAAFKANYAGQVEPEILDFLDRFPAAARAMITDGDGPLTIQHCDFRLDNILFDTQGGAQRMATLDWQTVIHGHGLADVAYFLSTGIDPDFRRAHEKELLRLYHDELVRAGVTDYDFDQCWLDYRRFTIFGILVGVYSFLVVPRSERGDAVFLRMARDSCIQAMDHQTFELWGA